MENFGFTLQIPAFLKVCYKDIKLPYSKLSLENQESFLGSMLTDITQFPERQIPYEVNYEKHKDGRIHAHGTFGELEQSELLSMQNAFCSKLGIKKPKQQNEVFNWIPLYDYTGWKKYITKDQEINDDEGSPKVNCSCDIWNSYNEYKFGKNKLSVQF